MHTEQTPESVVGIFTSPTVPSKAYFLSEFGELVEPTREDTYSARGFVSYKSGHVKFYGLLMKYFLSIDRLLENTDGDGAPLLAHEMSETEAAILADLESLESLTRIEFVISIEHARITHAYHRLTDVLDLIHRLDLDVTFATKYWDGRRCVFTHEH